ncbi:MAG TPA: cytochrome c oxidase subunit II [Terriglobia bacterium]|nr:cytochrome c oxidase subunit II [Terriglobia bacterium]
MAFVLPFHLEQASTISGEWQWLFYLLTSITVFFTLVIFGAVFYFAIKYRRRSKDEVPPQNEGNLMLELTWTIIPAGICVFLFAWSAELFVRYTRPPAAATEVFVVGKQWMWKIQHPEGPREINELHIPVGEPIKLTMTSEDVIHDFGVPAFRVKRDVVPGIYSSEWFQATETGNFHLFCDQYCGTGHSHMVGTIVVMKPEDYARWLSSQANVQPMWVEGERLFSQLGCATCHSLVSKGAGPALEGLYGAEVKLQSGKTVRADDAFLRSQILGPEAVAGYPVLMPTFQGQVNEEEVLELIAYIKSLGSPAERKAGKQ